MCIFSFFNWNEEDIQNFFSYFKIHIYSKIPKLNFFFKTLFRPSNFSCTAFPDRLRAQLINLTEINVINIIIEPRYFKKCGTGSTLLERWCTSATQNASIILFNETTEIWSAGDVVGRRRHPSTNDEEFRWLVSVVSLNNIIAQVLSGAGTPPSQQLTARRAFLEMTRLYDDIYSIYFDANYDVGFSSCALGLRTVSTRL